MFTSLMLALSLSVSPTVWADAFAALPTHGDGNPSCAVDGGRHVFLTGDAEDRSNPGWIGPHSTVTVADTAGAVHVTRPAYPGQNPYQAVREPDPSLLHWLGPCTYWSGKLYSLAPVVRQDPYGQPVGVDLVTFDVPAGGDPVFASAVRLPRAWSGGLYLARSTGLVYWFGAPTVTDGWTGRDVYVGRTQIGNIGVASSWYWWTGAATGWRRSPTCLSPVLRSGRDGGVADSFTVWWDSNGWNITSRAGGNWGMLDGQAWAVRKSTKDWSAGWSTRKLVQVPDQGYLVHEHRWIAPGMLTVNLPAPEPAAWLLAG